MNIQKQTKLTWASQVLILLLSISAFGQDQHGAMMVGSESHELKSAINGVSYKLLINLPASYSDASEKTYPVCYVLDGQWGFPDVVYNYWNLRYDGMLPEMIIVGLSYAGQNPDYGTLRIHDFIATKVPEFPGGGGAEKYVEVLRKEVIPFIDKTYRTNKIDRSLLGGSAGGAFVHYVMFNTPELFNAYVPINSALQWDDGKLFQDEEALAKKEKSFDARVFMVSGEFDDVASLEKMFAQIQSHHYEGLIIEKRVLDGMTHAGSSAEAHARGLKYIYALKGKKLSDAVLKQYTGTYLWSPIKVRVVARDGELFITDFPDGFPDLPILALNEKDFSLAGTYYAFTFPRDAKGNVMGMRIESSGNQIMEVTKVE